MRRKTIKIKVVSEKTKFCPPILEIDNIKLKNKFYLADILMGKVDFQYKGTITVKFIGTENSNLRAQDISDILNAIKWIFKYNSLEWDIINESPNQDEPNDLDGYLIFKHT